MSDKDPYGLRFVALLFFVCAVLFGSILIGAVHDFGSLVVSMRNRGQTVGDIAGRVLAPRTRILFLSILFMALTIVLAIFGLVIASVFKIYPQAIIPCMVQIPIAVAIGILIHRKGGNILIPSIIALAPTQLTGTPFDTTRWMANVPWPVAPNIGWRPPNPGINFVCTNVPGVHIPDKTPGPIRSQETP